MTSYFHEFTWPAHPETKSVVVTGNFDSWLKSSVLSCGDNGVFKAEVALPKEPIVFKFVVDGEWLTSAEYKTTQDEFGNSNNFLDVDELAVRDFALYNDLHKKGPQENTQIEIREGPKQLGDDQLEKEQEEKQANGDEDENLTQVLTAESSYASVSIPASAGSTFEVISESPEPDKPSCRTAPEDITPTNTYTRPQDADLATLGGRSCDSSISGRPETVAMSCAPGRKGLIVRLKSMFR